MAFKVTRMTNQGSIGGSVNEYICDSVSDIAKLPRVNVSGTQEDYYVGNAPCWYGSIAIICTGSETEVWMLTANNEWTKM